MKILLILLIFFSWSVASQKLSEIYPHLSKETIEYYQNISKEFPAINKMYRNFDKLSLEEKKELKRGVKRLFPQQFLHHYLKKDKQALKEFYALYLWFMNYEAYILVDKYYRDSDFMEAKVLALLVHKLLPSNISYSDTYLWSLVRSKEYEKAIQEYPKLINSSKDKDQIKELKIHYEYAHKKGVKTD